MFYNKVCARLSTAAHFYSFFFFFLSVSSSCHRHNVGQSSRAYWRVWVLGWWWWLCLRLPVPHTIGTTLFQGEAKVLIKLINITSYPFEKYNRSNFEPFRRPEQPKWFVRGGFYSSQSTADGGFSSPPPSSIHRVHRVNRQHAKDTLSPFQLVKFKFGKCPQTTKQFPLDLLCLFALLLKTYHHQPSKEATYICHRPNDIVLSCRRSHFAKWLN